MPRERMSRIDAETLEAMRNAIGCAEETVEQLRGYLEELDCQLADLRAVLGQEGDDAPAVLPRVAAEVK